MIWTQALYDRIKHLLPTQRGNVAIDNLTFLHSMHYIAENGCRFEKELQAQAIDIKGIKALALDSTYVKVHPNGTGTPKKGPQAIGQSRSDQTTKIHTIVADVDLPIARQLSPGSAADDPVDVASTGRYL